MESKKAESKQVLCYSNWDFNEQYLAMNPVFLVDYSLSKSGSAVYFVNGLETNAQLYGELAHALTPSSEIIIGPSGFVEVEPFWTIKAYDTIIALDGKVILNGLAISPDSEEFKESNGTVCWLTHNAEEYTLSFGYKQAGVILPPPIDRKVTLYDDKLWVIDSLYDLVTAADSVPHPYTYPNLGDKIILDQEMIAKSFKSLLTGELQAKQDTKQVSFFDAALATINNNNINTSYHPTNDPIENYMNLLKLNENIELENVIKSNRTLVIIHGDSSSSGDYQERVMRLVSGFNTHDNIKAVVVTITGDKFYNGVTFQNPPSDKVIDPEKLEATKKQFVQVVEVTDGRI
jgi:hypothetical protein